MKNTITILCLLVSGFVFAQSDTGSGAASDGFSVSRSDAKGSPFVNDGWSLGYLIDAQGNAGKKQMLGYDAVKNMLFYKLDGSAELYTIDISNCPGFMLSNDGKDQIFKKIDGSQFKKSRKDTKFYEIAKVPSQKVIIEHIKTYKDPNASGWSSSTLNTKGGEYKGSTKYFVLGKDDKYHKVSLSAGSVAKAFKDQKKALNAYIKSNNIKVKSAGDLLAIVEYYHTL